MWFTALTCSHKQVYPCFYMNRHWMVHQASFLKKRRTHKILVLYAAPYNAMSLDYWSYHPLAFLNQVPDLIIFYGHYSSSPDSFPISPNLMFAFVIQQCINLLIKGRRAGEGNTYSVLTAFLQLKHT